MAFLGLFAHKDGWEDGWRLRNTFENSDGSVDEKTWKQATLAMDMWQRCDASVRKWTIVELKGSTCHISKAEGWPVMKAA